MNLSPRRSLQRKLLRGVLLTTLVALLVALSAIVGFDLREYERSWVADLTTQAELLCRTSAAALAFDDSKAARGNLELLRYQPKVRAAAIYDARGGLFAAYRAEGETGEPPRLPEPDGSRVAGREGVVFRRVVENDEILGTVYLRAEYGLYERLVTALGIAAAVVLAAMGVAFLMSLRVQREVTRPILAVADVAREVVAGRDYSRRARKLSDDEVGALVDSFNAMLAEIESRTGALEESNRELAREVGERARAEAEIRRLNAELEARVRDRTARLEVAVRELEAFSYSVSHDLRGPLRAIDGFSQALVEDCGDEVSTTARGFLDRIRNATRRMGQLIDGLLDLSRISRREMAAKPVDLGEMATQILEDLRQQQPERSVQVDVWDGLVAQGDPGLVRAALENLLGNAWKFTARTESPRIDVGSLVDGGRTVFYVRDNGAGFDMTHAGKLFGAFERLHSNAEFPGNGIGLATVQRIVERHGGRIWADGKVGRGATFYFTLSPAPATEEREPPTAAAR